ncbi:MAG TPA: hypothetical protein VFA17_05405 [Thermoplasmata archaeon]|jgi:hypothetical protein|nr:hypothetical protein [Thermoplasmata archaeon]
MRRRGASSEKGRRATAVYLFYRSGEPLVALASGRKLPIEAENLHDLLSVVGNFVETSMPGSRGYAVTAMTYEEFGIVAVRGEFVIGAALYTRPADEGLKANLLRAVRDIEDRHWRDLSSWADATRVAKVAEDEMSKLLETPSVRHP